MCQRVTQGRDGFSLVEMLLVVVVLAVVAGLAVPNLSQTYVHLRLQNTVNEIVYMMRYAQSRAVTYHRGHRLEFDGHFSKYWLAENPQEMNPENESSVSFRKLSGRLGRVFHVPEDITLISPQNTIDFKPDGSMDKLRIEVCQEEKCFTISTKDQSRHVVVLNDRVQ